MSEVPAPESTRLYSVKTTAELLGGVSERFVWQLIHDKVLKPVKLGSRTMIRDDELARYIDERTVQD